MSTLLIEATSNLRSHRPRPWVAARSKRVGACSCKSYTAVFGRPSLNRLQVGVATFPLVVRNTPTSVPTKYVLGLTGSTQSALQGMSGTAVAPVPLMSLHVALVPLSATAPRQTCGAPKPTITTNPVFTLAAGGGKGPIPPPRMG